LRERHRWASGGEQSDFSRYWANLLRSVGREAGEAHWLSPPADYLPRPGRRQLLCAAGEGALALRVQSPGAPGVDTAQRLAMQPHASGAPLHCGQFWPAAPGWYVLSLLTEDGSSADEMRLKVMAPEQWRVARLAQREQATAERAERLPQDVKAPGLPRPLSSWWAWACLLLVLVPLWLERRLHDLR